MGFFSMSVIIPSFGWILDFEPIECEKWAPGDARVTYDVSSETAGLPAGILYNVVEKGMP